MPAAEVLPSDRGFRQITMLLHPFPARLIKENPNGYGSYVAHPFVEQRIIDVLGVPPKTKVVHIIRGQANGKNGAILENVVVGVVVRMEATVDGQEWWAEEAGDCENPSNWGHDGARLKDAMSDAYKRVAMRLGVALHLWAGGDFYLAQKLMDQDKQRQGGPSDG